MEKASLFTKNFGILLRLGTQVLFSLCNLPSFPLSFYSIADSKTTRWYCNCFLSRKKEKSLFLLSWNLIACSSLWRRQSHAHSLRRKFRPLQALSNWSWSVTRFLLLDLISIVDTRQYLWVICARHNSMLFCSNFPVILIPYELGVWFRFLMSLVWFHRNIKLRHEKNLNLLWSEIVHKSYSRISHEASSRNLRSVLSVIIDRCNWSIDKFISMSFFLRSAHIPSETQQPVCSCSDRDALSGSQTHVYWRTSIFFQPKSNWRLIGTSQTNNIPWKLFSSSGVSFSLKRPNRFWMKNNTEKKLLWVDWCTVKSNNPVCSAWTQIVFYWHQNTWIQHKRHNRGTDHPPPAAHMSVFELIHTECRPAWILESKTDHAILWAPSQVILLVLCVIICELLSAAHHHMMAKMNATAKSGAFDGCLRIQPHSNNISLDSQVSLTVWNLIGKSFSLVWHRWNFGMFCGGWQEYFKCTCPTDTPERWLVEDTLTQPLGTTTVGPAYFNSQKSITFSSI